MSPLSYPKEKIKILLLENIHPEAEKIFADAGYVVRMLKEALSPADLAKEIGDVHVLGIRSKTRVPKEVLAEAKRLLAVGCFCIGTDQIALNDAQAEGVPVFNAPFSNTRSVAELTIAEVILLSRQAGDMNNQMHSGVWTKTAAGCREVRHKSIGIVGYGHIGQQVGLLAESLGIKVFFFDIIKKLPLGNAVAVDSFDQLLEKSDFVTLHVPDSAETRGMIGERELKKMKRGAALLNLSRGTVVDVKALRKSLDAGHLGGAAVDVFPAEPEVNGPGFQSDLIGAKNVFMTPHVGGSTQEAQSNIGREVADALIKFLDQGSTAGAVNFPQADLPMKSDTHRMLNIHRNVPGVLSSITSIMARIGANISSQILATNESVGYLIMDMDKNVSREVKSEIDELSTTIKTRLLF